MSSTTYAFDNERFIQTLRSATNSSILQQLAPALADCVRPRPGYHNPLKHGHLPQWQAALKQLPVTRACHWSVSDGVVVIQGLPDQHHTGKPEVSASGTATPSPPNSIEHALKALMPWRKGPFRIDQVFIDTEWRSDQKWNRLLPLMSSLEGRQVLDVGCGSGYHLWRMREAGAQWVLGIDPSLLYLMQFNAIQHFIQSPAVQFLPVAMDALPARMHAFDTVFSMGVLYHRRDPHSHLQQLFGALRPGGELVLETLVVPETSNTVLTIQNRYANMRNIHELPSPERLMQWLDTAGFIEFNHSDAVATDTDEQRSTNWMSAYSLQQALDPNDTDKTIEGYPRPHRMIITAQRPG